MEGLPLTPLQETYNAVSGGAMTVFTIVAVLSAIVIFFLVVSRGKLLTAFVVAVVAFFGIHWVGETRAASQGEYAITTAWEQAKTDQATFIETLHAPFVGYGEDITYCYGSVNGGTNCKYYSTRTINSHQVCYTDDDGDEHCHEEHDTEYTPWFKYERSPWATADILPRLAEAPLQMVGDYPLPRQYFGDHLAPEDSEAYEWGSIPLFATYDSESPADWVRIRDAISNNGPVVVGNFPHKYLNFFHADDQNLFKLYDGNIPTYQSLGVLPTMNQIYNSYDYDFVQFNGVTPANPAEWQSDASIWAADAGRKLQASLILYFVPESKVGNRQEFISTSKAYLMQKSVFGRRILPKNLVLVGCAITSDNMIAWCEMDTGMYTGNHLVAEDVALVHDVPFTQTSVFGTLLSDSYGPADENGIHKANISFDTNGILSLLFRPEPDGFKRVSMGPNDYLRTNIKPSPEQIDAIIGNERGNSILFALVSAVVSIAIAYFFSASSSSER